MAYITVPNAVQLGRVGELIAMAAFEMAGMKVVLVNQQGFDILAFDEDGASYRVEVKSSSHFFGVEELKYKFMTSAGAKSKKSLNPDDADIICCVALDAKEWSSGLPMTSQTSERLLRWMSLMSLRHCKFRGLLQKLGTVEMDEPIWDDFASFSRKEMKCKCGCDAALMDDDFMWRLQDLREAYGRPMRITSAYRCPEHPIEAKKSKPGAHASGRAVDVAVSRGEAYSLMRLAMRMGFSGIGVQQKGDGRFIHLDDLEAKDGWPRPTVWSY